MRKAIALAVVGIALLSGCSSVDNSFVVENGNCYRIRKTQTLGVQTHSEKVLAVPENCGLPAER